MPQILRLVYTAGEAREALQPAQHSLRHKSEPGGTLGALERVGTDYDPFIFA